MLGILLAFDAGLNAVRGLPSFFLDCLATLDANQGALTWLALGSASMVSQRILANFFFALPGAICDIGHWCPPLLLGYSAASSG